MKKEIYSYIKNIFLLYIMFYLWGKLYRLVVIDRLWNNIVLKDIMSVVVYIYYIYLFWYIILRVIFLFCLD